MPSPDQDPIANLERLACLLVGIASELHAPDAPFDDLPRLVGEQRARIAELEAERAEDEATYWIAGRDDQGGIRLNQGRGALIAEGDDSRAEIEGWLNRCDNSQWRRKYAAALDLLDTEEADRD